jgi:hypothetical protein
MMKKSLLILIMIALVLPHSAAAWRLGDLYTDAHLEDWRNRYVDNIRWNFDHLVLGKLTPAERSRVAGVRLDFPLRPPGELRDHLLQFYAAGDTIVVPVQSVRFFDDLTQAWGWLWSNGHPLALVGDYLSMIKYRNPEEFPGGRFPPPLAALGIPEDAWKQDPRMDDVSQKALKSAMVWILAHELAHIYHGHPGYGPGVTRSEARENEIAADRFAAKILRRIGVAPVGMLQFFMAQAHLEPGRGDFSSTAEWRRYIETEATHPVTPKRLEAVAEDLRRSPHQFTTEETDQSAALERLAFVADQIESIGAILADPNIHRLTKAVGLATDLTSLTNRRRVSDEVQPMGPCPETGDRTPFNGRYTGLLKRRLASGKSEWLPGRADFQRSGNRVHGRISFGAGEGTIQGTVVKGARLMYDWQWGTAAGRGVLEHSGETGLQGDWQYADGTVGGAWALCPAVGP